MVDKNVAFNRDGRPEEFAEGDPLAELARIVGYEDRPRHVSPQAAPTAGVQQRRDPSFNLEDELLREFAIYDTPRDEGRVAANDAQGAAAEPIHANDFLQRVEDVFARREPAFEPAPAPTYQAEPSYQDDFRLTESPIGDDLRYTMNAQPQSYSDEIYADAQAYNPAVAQDETYQDQAYDDRTYDDALPHVSFGEPVASQEPSYSPVDYQQAADLSYEVEQSLVEEPIAYDNRYQEPVFEPQPAPFAPVEAAPQRAPQSARSSLEFSSMRQPLGNFSMSRATPFIPRNAATPAPAQQPQVAPVAVTQANEQPKLVAQPVSQGSGFEAGLPIQPASSLGAGTDLDALIADVSRYSIGGADRSTAQTQPTVAKSEPAKPTPIEPSFDLTDDAFEAALDDLDFEFDLSDIDLGETVSETAAVQSTAQVAGPRYDAKIAEPAVPVQARSVHQASAAFAPKAAAPIASPAPMPSAPQRTVPQAPVLDTLPFDVDQIGDVNEMPEAIADFDVPELPPLVIEPKQTVQRHDDDLELDTELAALFTPSAAGLDRNRNSERSSAQPASRAPDVDEFERALEEDFRRSLQENPTKPNKIQTVPVDDFDDHEFNNDHYDGDQSRKRLMVRAAAAVGALVVLGGAYAAFFSGSSTTSDGQPVVIAADDQPMKVVPENPGGRVVPNQDKAVYDRVSGGSPADPKQPALISSDETPVDVVQRTLIPEQMSPEDDEDFGASAISGEAIDTDDPRLLPTQTQEAAAQTTADAPVPVAPRRVRTMIVKADGTLVTQEVEAPAAPSAAPVQTPAVQAQAPVAQPTPSTPVATQVPRAVAPTPAVSAPTPVREPAPAPATPPPAPVVAAAPQAPVQTNSASSGGYYIQIASLPSDAEAQKTYRAMSSKFASVIGGRGVDIKRAEIAGKGTYYRVRIPAGDRSEANALCQRFQSAGGSCLVTR